MKVFEKIQNYWATILQKRTKVKTTYVVN